jgi:DsbC/DsbD-like thiol-disulfide interchange protein
MRPHVFAICATLLALGTSAAAAQSGPSLGLQSFELLNGWRASNGQHMAAVRIQLDKGWKTYWRTPGSFGIPAQFDWSGSKNIAEVRFHWPTPHIYREAGITTIGYKDELVLPIEFTPKTKGQDIILSADVEFGVCSDVCLPTVSRIDAVLSSTAKTHVPTIRASLANRPQNSASAGVRDVTCAVTPSSDGFQLTATLRTAKPLSDQALAIVEYPNSDIWVDGTQTELHGRELRVSTTLFSMTDAPLILDRSKLRLTLFDKARAIDIQGCPTG